MTKNNGTLWAHGMNCITMLAMAVVYAPFIPRGIKQTFTPVILLVLVLSLLFDVRKRASYSEGELEREKQDERNRMIQTRAVWYTYVTEDWALLGLFVVFGLLIPNEVIAYTLMYVLVARCLLSFGIRWWLNRKY